MVSYASLFCKTLLYFIFCALLATGFSSAYAQSGIHDDASGIGGHLVTSDNYILTSNQSNPLLEQVVGTWRLSSYTHSPIIEGQRSPHYEPMFKSNEGSLNVDQRGVAQWVIVVYDNYHSGYGPLEITSTAQIRLNGRMDPIKGGEFNNVFHRGNWQHEARETHLATMGWYGGESDPFWVRVGGNLLEMVNSRSTFVWFRN